MIICNLILKNNSLFLIRNKRHYSVLKKSLKYLPFKNKGLPLHPKSRTLDGNALLAQLVEQLTLNQWVQGSSP